MCFCGKILGGIELALGYIKTRPKYEENQQMLDALIKDVYIFKSEEAEGLSFLDITEAYDKLQSIDRVIIAVNRSIRDSCRLYEVVNDMLSKPVPYPGFMYEEND